MPGRIDLRVNVTRVLQLSLTQAYFLTLSLLLDRFLQVSRCGTQHLTWPLTSSSQEASSQSLESFSPLSSRQHSLAASLRSRAPQLLLLVRVRHCTLTSHTQRHSLFIKKHIHIFVVTFIFTLSQNVSGAHRRKPVLHPFTHKVTAGSQADTRAVFPFLWCPSLFYVIVLCCHFPNFPFHLSFCLIACFSF